MSAEIAPKKRTTFSLRVEAQTVVLVGEFTDWETHAIPLSRSKNGEWKKVVLLAPGRYEYKFIVDGQWVLDPSCPEHVTNSFGTENCVKTVSEPQFAA